MRPASTAFREALRGSHRMKIRCDLLAGGIPRAVPEVLDGTVTLDITAATRGRLDLTLVDDGTRQIVPTTSASPLAPYGNELRVSRGLRLPDGTDELVGLGVFRIDDVQVDETGDGLEVRVTGQDRSARIIDARFEAPYQIAAGTRYVDAIKSTITAADPTATFSFAALNTTSPGLIAAEGEDRWKLCQDMASSLGCVLYVDGDGVFVLRPIAQLGQAAAATQLVEGQDGLLLTASRRWTRQGTFNRVIATGENTGEGAPVRGIATDDNPLSPTYYYGPFGRVPRFYSSQFLTTAAQAQDAAQGILARELGTTQQVSFGTLVDPTLEPNDVVQVTRERAGIDELHIIDQLTIPLSATSPMTGRTRAAVVS